MQWPRNCVQRAHKVAVQQATMCPGPVVTTPGNPTLRVRLNSLMSGTVPSVPRFILKSACVHEHGGFHCEFVCLCVCMCVSIWVRLLLCVHTYGGWLSDWDSVCVCVNHCAKPLSGMIRVRALCWQVDDEPPHASVSMNTRNKSRISSVRIGTKFQVASRASSACSRVYVLLMFVCALVV